MPPPIKIRIGAATDASFDAVVGTIQKKMRKATQAIAADQKKGAAAGLAATKAAANAAEREERKRAAAATRDAQAIARAETKAADVRLRAALRLSREQERAQRTLQRELARTQRQEENRARAAERAADRARTAEARSFARRTSYRAARFFWPNAPILSMARSAAWGIGRGLGVDMMPSSWLARSVAAQDAAIKVANQAYFPGAAGAAGKRQDPEVLVAEARDLAKYAGMAREDIQAGLQTFVDKRGNLEGARSVQQEMAELAKGQGVSFEATMAVAAKLEATLATQAEYSGDFGKRMGQVMNIMRVLVFQGKQFSIPIEEMAKLAPRVQGLATMFRGDVSSNISRLTALAQLAGGTTAGSAAEAITQARNIAVQLAPKVPRFQKLGINVFDAHGKLRDIEDLSYEIMRVTATPHRIKPPGGTLHMANTTEQLRYLFPNIRAFTAIRALQQLYEGAGGGAAGTAALRSFWTASTKGATPEEMKRDFQIAVESASSTANKLNASFDEVADEARKKLAPALAELTPTLVDFVKKGAGVVQWAGANPKTAIAVGLGIATARAGVESVFRAGLESAIMRSALMARVPYLPTRIAQGGLDAVFKSTTGALRAGGASMVGALGALTASIAAAGVGIYLAGDQISSLMRENASEGGIANAFEKAGGWGGMLKWIVSGGTDISSSGYGYTGVHEGEDYDRWMAKKGFNKKRPGNVPPRPSPGMPSKGIPGGYATGATAVEMSRVHGELARLDSRLGGTINVNVVNAADLRGPTEGGGAEAPSHGRQLR